MYHFNKVRTETVTENKVTMRDIQYFLLFPVRIWLFNKPVTQSRLALFEKMLRSTGRTQLFHRREVTILSTSQRGAAYPHPLYGMGQLLLVAQATGDKTGTVCETQKKCALYKT